MKHIKFKRNIRKQSRRRLGETKGDFESLSPQTNSEPNKQNKRLSFSPLRRRIIESKNLSGVVAALLLFATLLTATVSTVINARAEGEAAETAAQASNLQLAKEYIYAGSRMLAVEDYGLSAPSTPTPTPTPQRTNVALAANGGTASASSEHFTGRFPASGTINGEHKGTDWGSGSGWNDNTENVYPDWLQIAFNGTKEIDEIDLFTIQDNYQSPIEPTENTTFSLYGITAFDIQYWNGSSWVTLPNGSITGNDKVWKKFVFSPITTNAVRVWVNNALASNARVAELEVYGIASSTTLPLPNATPTPTITPTPTVTPTPTPTPAKPDLVITNITLSPSAPVEGNAVNFTATVTNQGAGTMSGFLGIKYSIDGNCPPAGCPSQAASSVNIAPGQSVTLSGASPTWTAVQGTHTISAQVDDTGVVDESDESNNVTSLSVSVSPAPTPTPTPTPPCNPSNVTLRRCADDGGQFNFSTCECEFLNK